MSSTAPRSISGPISVPRLERVSDPDLRVGLAQGLDDRGRDALLQDQAPRGRAALARGPHRAEQDRADREVDVRVVHDDDRVVPAELEERPSQPLADDDRDPAAHPARAGRGDQREAAVGEHPLPDVRAAADDEIEHPREAVSLHHAVGDVLHGDRRERRLRRRLPDHRVAAHRRDRGVPRPHRDREVERGDDPDDAERVPLLVHPVLRPLRVHRQAVELARQADGEVADVDHLLDLAQPLRVDLPRLERDEAAERLLVRAQLVAEMPDDLAALRRGRHPPGRKRPLGGAHDGLVVLRRRLEDAPERPARRRVDRDQLRPARLEPRAGARPAADRGHSERRERVVRRRRRHGRPPRVERGRVYGSSR